MFFSVKLFGGVCLDGEDGPVTGPAAQRHRLALLALLVGAQPNGVSRDKLIAYLWPERDVEHARGLLKQAVHALRKALGEEAILSTGDELRCNHASVWSDVAEFEAALARGDPEGAAALYRGPFLDGFFLRDAPEFERWAEHERERLAASYAKGLEALAGVAEAEHDFERAVAWWKARAAQDPYDSRVALRLMQALAAGGNRAAALQHAAIHARLLEEEFGIEPAPEVVALVVRLRSDPVIAPCRGPDADDRAAGAPVPAHSPGGTYETAPPGPLAPPESASPSESAFPARTRSKLLWGAGTLVGAVSLTLATAVATDRLLLETGARPGAAAAAAVDRPRAIAVLPCANLSGDPEQEYFADGLTEELTGMLSQVHSLRVVARTSAFAFKGDHRDVREIGEALNVGAVLECSVRRAGERVRVAAQLINAADGFHLWSEMYEREGTDVFSIQSDLALRIARALEAELTPAERARLARRPTESAEAHALYLKGRHFWYQRTSAGFVRAIDYFQRAITADSQYARAYAGLATVYLLQGLSGDRTPQEAGKRTRAAALQALALDDELAEAHAALGGYFEAYAWDATAAEREWRRAIELDPNYPTVRHFYGNLLAAKGHFDEAIAQKRKAVQLDPLSPVFSEVLGNTLRRTGRPAEALEALRNAIELDSTYWRAHTQLGSVYEMLGSFEQAVRAHQRAVELAGADANVDTRFARIGLARALARAGRKDDARRMLAEAQAEADRTGFHRPQVATVFLALDDVDGAIEWLERSYREKIPELGARALAVLKDPLFAPLQRDPRFIDLLRRVGLPP